MAAWMLEALKADYDVALLTVEPFDLNSLNFFYHTTLKPTDLKVLLMPSVLRQIAKLDYQPYSIQSLAFLIRIAKMTSRNYDIVMSTYNELDLGCPAIQYIHYPWFASGYATLNKDAPIVKKIRHLLKYDYRPWRLISGYDYERMKKNVTLVNSDWTGRKVEAFYGIKTKTIYPPVVGNFPNTPWAERENGFVCIGRISHEKRIENVIAMLSEVKEQGHPIHLHIVAPLSSDRQTDYFNKIVHLVNERRSWISLHLNISRGELIQLIASHRYGIHGNIDEHFGIAVAELTVGGCIVFAPNRCGQVEIVAHNERLLYESVEDGREKIISVLTSANEQQRLIEALKPQKTAFTTQKFMSQIRETAREFCALKNGRTNS